MTPYMFLLAFLDLTEQNVQKNSYDHFELIDNRNIAFIYSVTISGNNDNNKKIIRIVHGQRASNINYSTVVLNFITTLLNMIH